jgi:tetratricopeptide (TPR) repeat protein
MGWDDPNLAKLSSERHLNEIWTRVESKRASGRPYKPDDEMLAAGLMREAGRDDRALELYAQLATTDIWAWVWLHKLRATKEAPKLDHSQRLEERDKLIAAIEAKSASCAGDSERAALLWFQAQLFVGLRLDDRVEDDDLTKALDLLEQARDLASNASWPLPEIVRIMRFQASRNENPQQGIARVLDKIEEFKRNPPTGPNPAGAPLRHPVLGLVYEKGRIALLNREWRSAEHIFTSIVRQKPENQHARVWRIYAHRLGHNSNMQLLAEIDELLESAFGVTTAEALPLPTEFTPATLSYADPYPLVCRPELVAMLLAERAAIREPLDAAQALLDYERALKLRSRMLFARRGELRCLDATGQNRAAERLALEFETEVDSSDTPAAVAAELSVEVGRYMLARRRVTRAVNAFDRAIEKFPSYGYAYERKLVALCMSDERELAMAQVKSALASAGGLRGGSGVDVELANVMLELGDPQGAQALYDRHVNAETAAIRDRAHAGRIHAHRYLRDYRGAERAIAQAREGGDDEVGFRVWDARARLASDLGDFSRALTHFEHGLAQRPRERTLLSGKARVLRLLGRPSAAYAFLDENKHRMGVFANEVLADLGWAEFERGRVKEANELFEQAYEYDRNDVLALRGIVVVDSQDWAYDSSQTHRVQALRKRLEPQRYAAGGMLTELGCRCLARGALGDAQKLFVEADENCASESQRITQLLGQGHAYIEAHLLDEAEPTIDRLESLRDGHYKNEPNVRLLRARWHLERGESEPAARAFAQVSVECERSQLAAFGRAAAAARRDDPEGALRPLEELIARVQSESGRNSGEHADNDSVYARELHVRVGLHAPRVTDEQVRAECKHILALEQRSHQANLALGVLAVRGERLKQAVHYFGLAAAVAPTKIEPLREQGWIAMLTSDRARAERNWDVVAEMDPHDARLYLLRGLLHQEYKEQTDAIVALRKAVALDPSGVEGIAVLADALDRAGEREEALRVLGEAVQRLSARDTLSLRLAAARIGYAMAIGEHNQLRDRLLEEAAREASAAGVLASGSEDKVRAEVHYHAGVICHAQKKQSAARRELGRCLALDADYLPAQQALARLGVDRDDEGIFGHARLWANVLGGAALLVFAAVGLDVFFHAEHMTTLIGQEAIVPMCAVALVALVVAALIPRMTSLNVRGVVSLTAALPSDDSARAEPDISFRRLPLNTLSGPGTGQLSPITPDTAGLASS